MSPTSDVPADHGGIDVDQLMRSIPLVGPSTPCPHLQGATGGETRADRAADGHNDFAWMVRGWLQNQLDDSSVGDLENMPIGQTDLRRLKESRIGCQFWSAFVPWSATAPPPPVHRATTLRWDV